MAPDASIDRVFSLGTNYEGSEYLVLAAYDQTRFVMDALTPLTYLTGNDLVRWGRTVWLSWCRRKKLPAPAAWYCCEGRLFCRIWQIRIRFRRWSHLLPRASLTVVETFTLP